MAGDLISALSRLFTAYLHFGGFTCGLDDLLLIDAAERERAELCETAELRALRASADFADVQMPSETAPVSNHGVVHTALVADAANLAAAVFALAVHIA